MSVALGHFTEDSRLVLHPPGSATHFIELEVEHARPHHRERPRSLNVFVRSPCCKQWPMYVVRKRLMLSASVQRHIRRCPDTSPGATYQIYSPGLARRKRSPGSPATDGLPMPYSLTYALLPLGSYPKGVGNGRNARWKGDVGTPI